jgi:hypothetical protein
MDDDDKVRRNLVVFSGGVLLLSWLAVPLTSVTERLIGPVTGWQINPNRAWAAAGVTLVYLAARFYFGGGAAAIEKVVKRYGNLLHWGISNLVTGKAERGSLESLAVWDPPIAPFIQQWSEAYRTTGQPANIKPRISIGATDGTGTNIWALKGKAQLRAHWIAPGNAQVVLHHEHAEIGYRLRKLTRARVWGRAVWLSWMFSEEAFSLLAPFWLAIGAGAVISWKLASGLF